MRSVKCDACGEIIKASTARILKKWLKQHMEKIHVDQMEEDNNEGKNKWI